MKKTQDMNKKNWTRRKLDSAVGAVLVFLAVFGIVLWVAGVISRTFDMGIQGLLMLWFALWMIDNAMKTNNNIEESQT